MKTTSPLLAGLFRSLSSNAKAEPQDPILGFSRDIQLVVTPPLPIYFPQDTNGPIRDSTTIFSGINWFTLGLVELPLGTYPEGVWRFTGAHYADQNGGAASATSFSELIIRITRPTGTSDGIISRARNLTAVGLVIPFDFTITIDSKAVIQFRHHVTSTLASNNISVVTFRALRLL